MRPRPFARGAAVLALSVLGVLGQTAATQAETAEPPDADFSGQGELYLEVFINGRSTELIAAFQQRDGEPVAATADELREIGLEPPKEGLVPLAELPGVSYEYDESDQAIRFTAADAALAAQVLRLRDGPAEDAPEAEAGWGTFANYTLFAAAGTEEQLLNVPEFQGVSGAIDAHLFSPYGSLEGSALLRFEPEEGADARRLNTTWTTFDVDRMQIYRAGDVISGGLSWTRPVRLGGLQVQRDFALRPDLVTMPLPFIEGSAAVPSAVDVFSNGVRIYSGELDSGPFVLSDVPVTTGASTTTIVVRDALGRDIRTDVPFYASPDLLRSGFLDFSAEAGFPRRSFGTESFDYGQSPFGSFTLRYGASDRLTAEAHGEVGEALVNGGVGAAFNVGPWGVASASLAGSRANGEIGALAGLGLEIGRSSFTAFGRVQHSFGEYHDIASVSIDQQEADDALLLNSRPLKSVAQVGLSFGLPFDPSRISLNYARRETTNGAEQQTARLSFNRPLTEGIHLHASAVALMQDEHHYGAFASISFPLGETKRGIAGARYDRDGLTAYAEASRSERREPNEIAWRLGAERGADTGVYAAASYRAPIARVGASAEFDDESSRVTAQADGSVVFAGGDFFLAHRINDAFAVVDAGGPNVDVFYENRPVGTTGRGGRIIIPDLRALGTNRISIDPSGLPVDVQVPTARQVVSPAPGSGVVVDFDVSSTTSAALVSFHDELGQPLELGSSVQLAGTGEEFMIGYDGEVYLQDLSERNAVVITRPDGTMCRAAFDFDPKKGAQVRMDGVVCVPD